jgi:hypothetical protein
MTLYGLCRGCGWPFSIGAGFLFSVFLYITNFKKFMRAGDGWFAYNEAYVRTDRLTHLRARLAMGSGTHVALKDADGRGLDVPLSDLGDDPKIWQLVVAGVHESVSHGLIVDDILTARIFAVARHTRSKKPRDARNRGETTDAEPASTSTKFDLVDE